MLQAGVPGAGLAIAGLCLVAVVLLGSPLAGRARRDQQVRAAA
jgi:hypothetical protein